MSIFDILITASGLYLIYVSVVLKTRGKVIKGVIVPKEVDVGRMRDKDGFIRYMFPKALLMGIFTVAAGGINLMVPYMHWPFWISIAAVSGYLVILMVFSAFVVQAGKKFV